MSIIRSAKQTPFSTQNTVYSDFLLDFDIHPNTGDLFLVTNDNAVKQSLRNIILTNAYERFYNPSFGGNLVGSLFEQLDPNQLYAMQQMLQSSIKNFEPRVNLISVSVKGSNANPYGVNVTLRYTTIMNASNSTPSTFNLFVARVR